jgi:hypothetical protein
LNQAGDGIGAFRGFENVQRCQRALGGNLEDCAAAVTSEPGSRGARLSEGTGRIGFTAVLTS